MAIKDYIKRISTPVPTEAKSVTSTAFRAMIAGRGWEDYTHWDKDKLIKQGFERNAPMYAAVSLIARTIASMPVYVEAVERGRKIKTEVHPLLSSMGRNVPISELLEYTALYLLVTGESYTNKVTSDITGKPLGFVTLPSQHTNPVQGTWMDPIKGFMYTEYTQVYLDKNEVVYIKLPNLREYWHGMSPAVAISELVDLNNAAITWNKNIALGGGVPPMVAVAPGITPDEASRLKDNWQQQSGAANAHRLRIVPDNLTIQRFSDKPQEAEWKEAVMMSMRMILMAFGVSSELLNDGANKTYSNFETARASLYTEACIPVAQRILDAFTAATQKHYDDNPKLCIDKGAIDAIQENRETKAKWVTSLVDKRIMTPQQAADELGIAYDAKYFEAMPEPVRVVRAVTPTEPIPTDDGQ